MGQNPLWKGKEELQVCVQGCWAQGQRPARSFHPGNPCKMFPSLLFVLGADPSYLCQYCFLWVKCRYRGVESTGKYSQINTFSSLFHAVTCGQLQWAFLWVSVFF